MKPLRRKARLSAAALFTLTMGASAQTVTWTGPDTGPWHTGGNWTPAGVPGAGSDVVIDGETATSRIVNLDSGGSAVNRLSVSAGDTLRVNGSTFIQTNAAGYTIDGLLELTGGGDTRLHVPVADTVLEGSGEVRMQPGTRIHGGGSLLIRGALTGAGNAGGNETMLTVEAPGRLAATISGQAFTLDPRNRGSDPGLINQGLMEAVNGGVLALSGFGGGWFNNTGGTLRAQDGSEVQFHSEAGLDGGTFAVAGTGLIRVNSGTNAYLSNFSNTGRLVVDNNAFLRSGGAIANTGTITLNAAGNSTRLQINTPTTLTGSGKLVMSGGNAHVGGTPLLTHTGGHTIEGQGNLGINETPVLNEAGCIVQANVSGAVLGLDPRNRDGESLPGFTNRGLLRARDGGVLQLNGFGGGWFDSTGGTVLAMDGSTVQFVNSVSLGYGSLATEGTGVLEVPASQIAYWTDLTHSGRTVVENNAYLRSSGTITNTGTITLNAAGNSTRLQMHAPTTLTGSGRLVMSGSQNAHIGGLPLLTNTGGHTIEGQGNLGINETPVLNEAGCIVQANVSGAVLSIDPRNRDGESLPGFTNRGLLRARDGGVLQINGFGGGWFDSTSGTVLAMDGSTVQFVNSVSLGYGSLATEGTGVLEVPASQIAYWTDLTHSGRTVVENNAYLRSSGTITNTGTITLNAAGNSTRLQMHAPTTLTGSGRLVMSGSQNAHIGGLPLLTNTGGHTIEGQGNLGINETPVLNDTGCVIQANVSGTLLTIDPRNRDAESLPGFINRGTLQARDGGLLWLTGFGGGWFDNEAGVIRALDGAEVQMADNLSIGYGTLTSEGTGRLRVMDSRNVYWTDLQHSGATVVNNNAWLRTRGIIRNPGSITLEAAGNSTRLQLEANTTLNSGGRLIMAGSLSNAHVGGGFLLTSDGHTIEGHGNIGINEGAFFNTATGLVNANFPARGLTIDPGGTKLVTNRGIFRASNGGDLYLSGFGGGSFDNANGIVEALDGSRVFFVNGAAISGGVFRTSGSGALVLPGSQGMTFTASTTNTGLFIAENNATVSVGSRLTNSGVMRFVSGANLSSLVLQDNTTLAGGGAIEMVGGNARIAGAAVLIVEDQTIRGTGNIGWNEASISVGEHGLVIADVPGGTLNFDPSPLFGFTNEGTLRAENGGILNLSSFGGGDIFVGATGRMEAIEGGRVQFDNNTNLINLSGGTLTGGTWRVQGRNTATSMQLPGGNITTNAATIELDGAQAQFAQLAGLTTNNGSLALSHGAALAPTAVFANHGALTVGAGSSLTPAAGITFGAASSLRQHISGAPAAPGAVSLINSGGPVTLAGQLTVEFDPGFTPAAGQTWTLITGSLTGTFSQVFVRGLSSGLQADITYTGGVQITLSARDGISYNDWASLYNFATPADAAATADPDNDGLNNLLEYALGTHPLEFEAGAAPEPVVVTAGGQSYPGLRYWKPAGAARRLGVTCAPEQSGTGGGWSSSGILTHSTEPADAAGRERITVRLTAPFSAAARHLMRLKVTAP